MSLNGERGADDRQGHVSIRLEYAGQLLGRAYRRTHTALMLVQLEHTLAGRLSGPPPPQRISSPGARIVLDEYVRVLRVAVRCRAGQSKPLSLCLFRRHDDI